MSRKQIWQQKTQYRGCKEQQRVNAWIQRQELIFMSGFVEPFPGFFAGAILWLHQPLRLTTGLAEIKIPQLENERVSAIGKEEMTEELSQRLETSLLLAQSLEG